MANFLYLPFLLLTLLCTTSISAHHLTSRSPSPKDLYRQQLDSVVDAIIGSGDFGNWADTSATNTDPSTLPFSVTFFIPSNNETTLPPLDFHLFPYHIVPTRLTFANLLLLKPGDRLPTLLPNYKILVTNVSRENFTIDNSKIVYPDLYATSSIAAHGIETTLDYKGYGEGKQPMLPLPPPKAAVPKPQEKSRPGQEELKKGGNPKPKKSLPPQQRDYGQSTIAPGALSSDGIKDACISMTCLVVFMVFNVVLALNLHGIGTGPIPFYVQSAHWVGYHIVFFSFLHD